MSFTARRKPYPDDVSDEERSPRLPYLIKYAVGCLDSRYEMLLVKHLFGSQEHQVSRYHCKQSLV